MKTKLDVLGSAMKWPTPVMERERKGTVGVCSHTWRMQSEWCIHEVCPGSGGIQSEFTISAGV